MGSTEFSRRKFAQTLAATAAAALVGPRMVKAAGAGAMLPDGMPESTIQLNSNENPYGPCSAALTAMQSSEAVACRYPDGAHKKMTEAVARLHGIAPENVALGCGSTQILDLCDFAFLAPDRRLVVAEPTFQAVLRYS